MKYTNFVILGTVILAIGILYVLFNPKIEGFSGGVMSQMASNQQDTNLYGGNYRGAHNDGVWDNIAKYGDVLSPTTPSQYNDMMNNRGSTGVPNLAGMTPFRQQTFNHQRPPLTPEMQRILMHQQQYNRQNRMKSQDNKGYIGQFIHNYIDPIFRIVFKILNSTIGTLF